MSLKAFHFVTLLVVLISTCAYGMWCMASFLREGMASWLVVGIPSLAIGIALLMHGVIFYKQTEDEPWL